MNVLEKSEQIVFSYRDRKILDGISMDIRKGEILGVLGPNGCGKTTFIKHLNKNLVPDSGRVVLLDSDLSEMSKKDIARTVSSVPQGNEIRFTFTVREIVAMGRMPFQDRFSPESREDRDIIENAIEMTNLTDYKGRYINELSGGERQRVIIARALAQSPEIILMDEPTLHLDVCMQFDVLNLVQKLSREQGLTVVIVSHDLGMVARYCDRIVMMRDRRVLCEGTPQDVLTPENMRAVFNVDAELIYDGKIGRNTVLLHDSCGNVDRRRDAPIVWMTWAARKRIGSDAGCRWNREPLRTAPYGRMNLPYSVSASAT